MLDPFLPEDPDDVARLKSIHTLFIALVKQSRGARLKGADGLLFTGEYWAGETSVGPNDQIKPRAAIDYPYDYSTLQLIHSLAVQMMS
jgi:hypothetical protein